jgi:predicted AAA+ superfamily ATPase
MKIPENIRQRPVCLERIRPFIRKNLIKVLSGQRRVGKSFLLYQIIQAVLAEDPTANIIYINKEQLSFGFIRDAASLNDYILSQLKKGDNNYIFIDEIQDIVGFENALRSLLLDPANDIYITGSNAALLSGELATQLSGRYIEFNIYSLAYTEFLAFHSLEDLDDSLEKYARFGGLPWLANLPLKPEVVNEYISDICSSIVYRDVVARYNLRNTVFLEKLLHFLADNTGSLFSAKRISDFLKSQKTNIAANQVQQYCSYFASAYIIHEAKRYEITGRKIFESGSKFYFEDTGIRNVVAGYGPKDRGKLLENMIYNHLLVLGYEVKVGYLHEKEIDFVAEQGHERVYLQAALRIEGEATVAREFGNLLSIPDNYPKLVVTWEHFEGNSYDGIRQISLREFLRILKL